eukprot:TRINITY_DN26589_c0_g1_i2.p2 TRINITY_DN26589_c0_g1~~TRINITY_DN26589_c0_g1_i2.p2  ORF type:complete len:188 (+),score=20.46 TRINITY_DN26589_c0_g1_i2:423-986(+)
MISHLHSQSFFHGLVSSGVWQADAATGEYFIDRDPKFVGEILNYLRSGRLDGNLRGLQLATLSPQDSFLFHEQVDFFSIDSWKQHQQPPASPDHPTRVWRTACIFATQAGTSPVLQVNSMFGFVWLSCQASAVFRKQPSGKDTQLLRSTVGACFPVWCSLQARVEKEQRMQPAKVAMQERESSLVVH